MSRPKVALYWCSGCGGCEASILDVGPDLLELADRLDFVFWPALLDWKRSDLEALEDGEVDAAIVNGAVRTEEDAEMARLLRRKARRLVAHGACAHLGGVVGLGNLRGPQSLLEEAFRNVDTVRNPSGILPGARLDCPGPVLPPLREKVCALGAVVRVDHAVPGCPPTPAQMREVLVAVAEKRLAERGSVFAEEGGLCATCPRRSSLPSASGAVRFRRVQEAVWDPERCFLAEGLACLGPATRGGCGARCVKGNAPCRGCFGPVEEGRDQGGRAVALLAALAAGGEGRAAEDSLERLPDPAGLCYRHGLAVSVLRRGGGDKP